MTSRLLCGGQGLRGFDLPDSTTATCDNACPVCILEGKRIAETLSHVVFHCPAYNDLRREPGASDFLGSVKDRIILHRDALCWSTLRAAITFVGNLGSRRFKLGSWKAVRDEVTLLWQDHTPS